MKYTVSCMMLTPLKAIVEASSEEEAIEKAKEMADNGEMTELEAEGVLDYWEAEQAKA